MEQKFPEWKLMEQRVNRKNFRSHAVFWGVHRWVVSRLLRTSAASKMIQEISNKFLRLFTFVKIIKSFSWRYAKS